MMTLRPIKNDELPTKCVLTKHALFRAKQRLKRFFKLKNPEAYLMRVAMTGELFNPPTIAKDKVGFARTDKKIVAYMQVDVLPDGKLSDLAHITTIGTYRRGS